MEKKSKKVFKPILISTDSTGKITWNVEGKEESWFINPSHNAGIRSLNKSNASKAYDESKVLKTF